MAHTRNISAQTPYCISNLPVVADELKTDHQISAQRRRTSNGIRSDLGGNRCGAPVRAAIAAGDERVGSNEMRQIEGGDQIRSSEHSIIELLVLVLLPTDATTSRLIPIQGLQIEIALRLAATL